MNPTITLAGVTYEIPALAIRQNKHVEPLAAKHLDYFGSVQRNDGRIRLLEITEEQAEDFQKIVYHAVTRATPSLTYEAFQELPISMKDIVLALPVCLSQCGLFKPAVGAPPQTGEGLPSTGTA